MLEQRQAVVLCACSAVFWLADVGWIRWVPMFVTDPFWGDLGFVLSIPVAWICIRLVERLGRLERLQLVPGVTLMVVVAALLHALALRWAPGLYGDAHAGRLGGAWLLWVYGLILGAALLAARLGTARALPWIRQGA